MYAAAGGASLASRQKRKNQAAQNVKNKALLQQGLKEKLAASRASGLAAVPAKAQSRAFHNLPTSYLLRTPTPMHQARKLSSGGYTAQSRLLLPIDEACAAQADPQFHHYNLHQQQNQQLHHPTQQQQLLQQQLFEQQCSALRKSDPPLHHHHHHHHHHHFHHHHPPPASASASNHTIVALHQTRGPRIVHKSATLPTVLRAAAAAAGGDLNGGSCTPTAKMGATGAPQHTMNMNTTNTNTNTTNAIQIPTIVDGNADDEANTTTHPQSAHPSHPQTTHTAAYSLHTRSTSAAGLPPAPPLSPVAFERRCSFYRERSPSGAAQQQQQPPSIVSPTSPAAAATAAAPDGSAAVGGTALPLQLSSFCPYGSSCDGYVINEYLPATTAATSAAVFDGPQSPQPLGDSTKKLISDFDESLCDTECRMSTCDQPECAQGRAAWVERGGRRCSVQENSTSCHRRWVKRNRIHDSSLGSSGDDDFLGVLRGPSSFANAFLYVGLGTVAIGLVIAFVGTGEKGFKTTELRLIGPSLIGIGLVCCVLRILFCICPSHCISSGRRKLNEKNAKVGVDHTTSLLQADTKRVSISKTCVSESLRDANKHNVTEGIDALRQIASTSLYLHNEQTKPLGNVPTIKEPDKGGRDGLIEMRPITGDTRIQIDDDARIATTSHRSHRPPPTTSVAATGPQSHHRPTPSTEQVTASVSFGVTPSASSLQQHHHQSHHYHQPPPSPLVRSPDSDYQQQPHHHQHHHRTSSNRSKLQRSRAPVHRSTSSNAAVAIAPPPSSLPPPSTNTTMLMETSLILLDDLVCAPILPGVHLPPAAAATTSKPGTPSTTTTVPSSASSPPPVLLQPVPAPSQTATADSTGTSGPEREADPYSTMAKHYQQIQEHQLLVQQLAASQHAATTTTAPAAPAAAAAAAITSPTTSIGATTSTTTTSAFCHKSAHYHHAFHQAESGGGGGSGSSGSGRSKPPPTTTQPPQQQQQQQPPQQSRYHQPHCGLYGEQSPAQQHQHQPHHHHHHHPQSAQHVHVTAAAVSTATTSTNTVPVCAEPELVLSPSKLGQ